MVKLPVKAIVGIAGVSAFYDLFCHIFFPQILLSELFMNVTKILNTYRNIRKQNRELDRYGKEKLDTLSSYDMRQLFFPLFLV